MLQHMRSAANYYFGYLLYLAPTDVLLHIRDSITGYNNKTIIAGLDEGLELNKELKLPDTKHIILIIYQDQSKARHDKTTLILLG